MSVIEASAGPWVWSSAVIGGIRDSTGKSRDCATQAASLEIGSDPLVGDGATVAAAPSLEADVGGGEDVGNSSDAGVDVAALGNSTPHPLTDPNNKTVNKSADLRIVASSTRWIDRYFTIKNSTQQSAPIGI
jgi:hypothetical protein